MTEEELREALRAHGFGSLNEFLDMRDEVNNTSAEIKHKLLCEELEIANDSGDVHACYTCAYKTRNGYLEPCKSCERCSKWMPKEEEK